MLLLIKISALLVSMGKRAVTTVVWPLRVPSTQAVSSTKMISRPVTL